MKKIVKSHYIVYIIVGIILIAGLGTGIYFYIHNKASKPNDTPTECKENQTVCRDDKGQSVCCDHGCCKTGEGLGIGVCLNEDQQCINNKPCDNKLVCKHANTDKTICCTNDKPNCNTASGTCNNCTETSPACEGEYGKAPTCCTSDKCYDVKEDKNNNPCVCCNGVQGMGGACCSKNRCLCPGEYYGRKDISGKTPNTRTRKPDGTCALKGKPKCITPDDIKSGDLANVAIDDIGEICDINKIYYKSSTKQWLCCNNTIYWDSTKKSLQCCSEPNAKVGNSSICYSDEQRSNISQDSPLYGMCSGIDDSSLQVNVCVNTTNFNASTFSKPSDDNICASSQETVVKLPYYQLINQPGIISYTDKDGKPQKNYPQTLSKTSITNINQLNTFTGQKCSKNLDCSNKTSGGCVDKKGNHVIVNGKQITNCDVTKGQYPSGECGTGCPINDPTTICGQGEICYTYESKKSDGNTYTSGFCGIPSKNCQQKEDSIQEPPHLQTVNADNQNLYYKTPEECQEFCENKRHGYCLTDSDNKSYCYLPTCTDGKSNYIIQGAAGMTSKNTINFAKGSTCSMPDCMLLQNKQHVKDISYDASNNICTANFDCSSMLVENTELPDTYMYGVNAVNKGFKGEQLYTPSGTLFKYGEYTPYGPYSLMADSDKSCDNNDQLPTGKYCTNGNTCNNGTCSPSAGIF